MTIRDLQVILYTAIISRLMGVVDEFGDHIAPQTNGLNERIEFALGYEVRPESFNHNYQRDKFLQVRDKYMYALLDGNRIHILTEKNKNEVILFTKPLNRVFGKDTNKVVKLLTKMLHRMYDTISVEEKSGVHFFDTSNSRIGSNGRFSEV